MKIKLASFISIIGHPLLTLSFYSIIAFFTYEEFQIAVFHTLIIIGGIFIPLTIKMYRNSKNGKYTNFDVSDKNQRQSWYNFTIIILLFVTLLLFVTEQPRTLRLSVLFSFILLSVSQLLNFYIKSSLHVSLNIFLGFLIIPMNLSIGIIILFFTVLIGWARITLKRHTINEIIVGSILGVTIGLVALNFISHK